MKKNNIILEKSKRFAVRIVRMYKYLCDEKREFVLSKQVLRSGTSIGANVAEATRGYSKQDFMAKIGIALKETSETEYWLELLYETDYITERQFNDILSDCKELIRILTAILNTSMAENEHKRK